MFQYNEPIPQTVPGERHLIFSICACTKDVSLYTCLYENTCCVYSYGYTERFVVQTCLQRAAVFVPSCSQQFVICVHVTRVVHTCLYKHVLVVYGRTCFCTHMCVLYHGLRDDLDTFLQQSVVLQNTLFMHKIICLFHITRFVALASTYVL